MAKAATIRISAGISTSRAYTDRPCIWRAMTTTISSEPAVESFHEEAQSGTRVTDHESCVDNVACGHLASPSNVVTMRNAQTVNTFAIMMTITDTRQESQTIVLATLCRLPGMLARALRLAVWTRAWYTVLHSSACHFGGGQTATNPLCIRLMQVCFLGDASAQCTPVRSPSALQRTGMQRTAACTQTGLHSSDQLASSMQCRKTVWLFCHIS